MERVTEDYVIFSFLVIFKRKIQFPANTKGNRSVFLKNDLLLTFYERKRKYRKKGIDQGLGGVKVYVGTLSPETGSTQWIPLHEVDCSSFIVHYSFHWRHLVIVSGVLLSVDVNLD